MAAYKARPCENCGKPFSPVRHDQVFCSRPCKVEEHNRELTRAKAIYREVYHWRKARGSGRMGKLLGCVSRKMDEFIAEDVRLGRQPPPLPQRIQDEDYWQAIARRGEALKHGNPE